METGISQDPLTRRQIVQSNTSTETIDTGEIGEQLVQEHFKHAERSEDWYGINIRKKDGTRYDGS